MVGVFERKLLIKGYRDNLLLAKSHVYEQQFEKNIKPLLNRLTNDPKESYEFNLNDEFLFIQCCFENIEEPYCVFTIPLSEIYSVRKMPNLFNYQVKTNFAPKITKILLDTLKYEIKGDVLDFIENWCERRCKKQNASKSFKG